MYPAKQFPTMPNLRVSVRWGDWSDQELETARGLVTEAISLAKSLQKEAIEDEDLVLLSQVSHRSLRRHTIRCKCAAFGFSWPPRIHDSP
jgi:hypothetical protein